MARISTLKDDPGYDPRAAFKVARVFLDGVEIKDVCTADEEQGYVLRGRSAERYESRGVVKIEWRT